MNRRLGVLISGRGSNLQAIIDAIAGRRLDAELAVVISNRTGAAGLQRARAAGIETLCIPHAGFASRDDFDRAGALGRRFILELERRLSPDPDEEGRLATDTRHEARQHDGADISV